MLRIDVLTLFPDMFTGVLGESIMQRARQKGLVRIRVHNLRDWSADKHRKVDDSPYGGGPGMVLSCQPIFDAVASLKKKESRVILLSPQGRRFDHPAAKKFARRAHLVMICGRYEGIDERVRAALATDEISVGDYVLTGGEIPAMVLIDAVSRLVPGVLGNERSAENESFSAGGLLEYPQYTRPRVYRGLKVPAVLLTGDHKKIEAWRFKESLKKTRSALRKKISLRER